MLEKSGVPLLMPEAEATVVAFGVGGIDCHDPKIIEFSANHSALAGRIAVGVAGKVVFFNNRIRKPVYNGQGFYL